MKSALHCFILALALLVTSDVEAQSYAFTTLAGTDGKSDTVDGIGVAGQFYSIGGIAADAAGNLYLAGTGSNTIHKVSPAGVVTTIAGTAGLAGNVDGIGAAARFNWPVGLAVDAASNVYVVDSENFAIRKITPSGSVTTIVRLPGNLVLWGSHNADYPYQQTKPAYLALDADGNFFVSFYYDYAIYKVSGGVVTRFAGTQEQSSAVDGIGQAAGFGKTNAPLAVDGAGNLFVADFFAIRKVTPAGRVTTWAGVLNQPGTADGAGSAARFGYIGGIAADRAGRLVVADTNYSTLRMVTPDGIVTTIAGNSQESGAIDGVGANARFSTPFSVAFDSTGNIYLLDATGTTLRQGVPSSLPSPPIITAQPTANGGVNGAIGAGTAVSFTGAASSPTPVTYQWTRNGAPIVGATSATCVITAASASDEGAYRQQRGKWVGTP